MREARLTCTRSGAYAFLKSSVRGSSPDREGNMSRHQSPSQVHAKLKHPVVDGDGHWLEFAPVFSEKMRKAGGDKAADGFLAALRSTTDALKMTPEERRRRRVAMPNFWNRQAEHTLARAMRRKWR